MKIRIFLLLAVLALTLPLRAQWSEDLDTLCQARLMVMYELTYREDTNHMDCAKKERMLLLIGDEISFFQSYNAYRSLNEMREKWRKGIFETVIHVKSDDISRYQFKIFKNYPVGKVTMIDRVLMTGTFLYEEDYPCMIWEFTEDTATINGHFTQKAICDYGGRTWAAWFAPELPYNDGPYMFCGLPGLIVRIVDTQEHYCFEMVSAEIPEETPIIWENVEYVRTTKKAYFKAYDDYMANIIENALPNIVATGGNNNDVQTKLYKYAATKNNPIELDRK